MGMGNRLVADIFSSFLFSGNGNEPWGFYTRHIGIKLCNTTLYNKKCNRSTRDNNCFTAQVSQSTYRVIVSTFINGYIRCYNGIRPECRGN